MGPRRLPGRQAVEDADGPGYPALNAGPPWSPDEDFNTWSSVPDRRRDFEDASRTDFGPHSRRARLFPIWFLPRLRTAFQLEDDHFPHRLVHGNRRRRSTDVQPGDPTLAGYGCGAVPAALAGRADMAAVMATRHRDRQAGRFAAGETPPSRRSKASPLRARRDAPLGIVEIIVAEPDGWVKLDATPGLCVSQMVFRCRSGGWLQRMEPAAWN